jgi:hypothetical protein
VGKRGKNEGVGYWPSRGVEPHGTATAISTNIHEAAAAAAVVVVQENLLYMTWVNLFAVHDCEATIAAAPWRWPSSSIATEEHHLLSVRGTVAAALKLLARAIRTSHC